MKTQEDNDIIVIEGLEAEVSGLRAINAELLAALQEYTDYPLPDYGQDSFLAATRMNALVVIAKAEKSRKDRNET